MQTYCVAKTKETLDMVSVNKLVCLDSEFHLYSPACRLRCVCVDSAGWCTWRFSDVALRLVSMTVATLGDIRSRETEEAEIEECLLLPDLLYLSLWSAEVISYIPPLWSSKSLEEIRHSVNAYIQVWQIPHFSCLCEQCSSLIYFLKTSASENSSVVLHIWTTMTAEWT